MVLLRYKTTFSIPEHANVRHFFILPLYNILMRGSRNFRQGGGGGGPGRSDRRKKAVTFFGFFCCFFVCFLSPQLILQKSNGQSQRNLSSFKVLEGVQHFPGGGPPFSRGGGSGPPIPPLDPDLILNMCCIWCPFMDSS